MGNFYVNHTVRAPRDRVVTFLKKEGQTAFVSPTKVGYTVVYDKQCDAQDMYAITELGEKMSAALKAPVLAFLNHDDDLLCYWVFHQGELVEEYNSCPDYFDEEGMDIDFEELGLGADDGDEDPGYTTDGAQLCRHFGTPAVQDRVRSILEKPGQVFVMMTHQELVNALGLPEWTVGAGYRYIANNDAEPSREDCVHVQGRRAGGLRVHKADEDDEE